MIWRRQRGYLIYLLVSRAKECLFLACVGVWRVEPTGIAERTMFLFLKLKKGERLKMAAASSSSPGMHSALEEESTMSDEVPEPSQPSICLLLAMHGKLGNPSDWKV
jgi:hypothetical protein